MYNHGAQGSHKQRDPSALDERRLIRFLRLKKGDKDLLAFAARVAGFQTLIPSFGSRFQPVSMRACTPRQAVATSTQKTGNLPGSHPYLAVTPVLRFHLSQGSQLKYASPFLPLAHRRWVSSDLPYGVGDFIPQLS